MKWLNTSGGEQYVDNNLNKDNIENIIFIYASYKQKYLEHLKIDFLRLIFTDDKRKIFKFS
ncbi:hypothetical protein ABSA28_00458 [Candidatus Hepatincolaceae symbiont of Richtersius coronifer]